MKIFIHWMEECFWIPDYPVCHCCLGDRSTILLPVFFLTVVWQAVTELLIHYPRNGTLRSHSIQHMGFSIFSFFDCREILSFTFWAAVADTAIFNHLQLCRYKYQFPADEFFPDWYQTGTTDRAFLFFKIKIFLCHRDSFIAFYIGSPGFSPFCFFQEGKLPFLLPLLQQDTVLFLPH